MTRRPDPEIVIMELRGALATQKKLGRRYAAFCDKAKKAADARDANLRRIEELRKELVIVAERGMR